MNQRIRGRRWVLPVFTVRRGYVAMILCRDEPMALLRASEAWERGLVGWPVPVGAQHAEWLIRERPGMKIDPYRVNDLAREARVDHRVVRRLIERAVRERLRDNPQGLGNLAALPEARYRELLAKCPNSVLGKMSESVQR